MKIGIAISTYNRNEIFDKTLRQIKKYLPKDAVLEIVDDGSDIVHPEVTYAFQKNVGTPVVKNKCLRLLYDKGCEHIFLFDNDCYPIVKDWHLPYINSGEVHLNFTPRGKKKTIKDHLSITSQASGCMMYYNRCVLDIVGGIDLGFKFYGGWHNAYTRRIYMAGLTSYQCMDVVGSENLFVLLDIETSRKDWKEHQRKNFKLKKATRNSTKYHPFE